MAIRSFTCDQTLLDHFINFGYDHYRGDPNWIPPLRRAFSAQLSSGQSFFHQAGSRHRHFLAMKGGRVVGRISAFVNPQLHDRDGEPVGTVGFFECTEDYGTAEELLTASVGWLKDAAGVHRVWGPMNYGIWHGYRFMTKGFDRKIFLTEPYNKPYYPEFFVRFGFGQKQVWNSVDLNGREAIEGAITRGMERHRQLVDRGYRFRPIDIRQYGSELCRFHSLLSSSFAGFLGYTAISAGEFQSLFSVARYAVDPSLFVFGLDEKDNLAGFAASFIDIAERMRLMNGRDDLLSKCRLLLGRKQSRRIIFYFGGVTPEEEMKHLGWGRAGFYHVLHQALLLGYEEAVVALMAQGNVVRGLLGGKARDAQREYALFELNTEETSQRDPVLSHPGKPE